MGGFFPLRSDSAALLREHIINLPPGLAPRYLHSSAKVAVHWEKRNIQTFQALPFR